MRIGAGAVSMRNINDQVDDLPECPVCGYLTRVDVIEINATDGSMLNATILRCVNTLRGECSFVVPLTRTEGAP